MPVASPVHLATALRGAVPEAMIRGHLSVVDSGGNVLVELGDPDALTPLRSCVKPLQALPFVRRAMSTIGASEAELALACASHNGEPVHVETAQRLLERAGLDERALACGPQLPYDQESAAAALRTGSGARALTNNCSGKHAAMLSVCVAEGWPTTGYVAGDHPLQAEIRRGMGAFGGLDLDRQPFGIDGCGLQTYGVPLAFLARSFAAASPDPDFQRCQQAMARHPYLVAGRDRFDTAILSVAGAHLTVKAGGAAIWVAVRRPAGPALAIKLEAGEASAVPTVALTALEALGWLSAAELAAPELERYRRPLLRNWAGNVTGSIEMEPAWARRLVA